MNINWIFSLVLGLSMNVHADKVISPDDLDRRIGYASGTLFDFCYYKDLYDLELRHHGDMDSKNSLVIDVKKNLVIWEVNYRKMLDSISKDKLILAKESRLKTYKFKCRTLSGSKLIALFSYIKLNSPDDYNSLISYYLALATEYERSQADWKLGLVKSWKQNFIPIPEVDQNKKIRWLVATPYDYLKGNKEPVHDK